MSRSQTLRNVLIVIAIAAVVQFVPGGSRGAAVLEAVLWTGFGVGLGYVAVHLYREHRISLHSLGPKYRALLYGALALGAVLLAGRAEMWSTAGGELLWFVLLALGIYAVVLVYRSWRSY